MRLLRILNSIMDRLVMLLGAFLGSQIPEFMQQYTQRLSGHAAELSLLVNKLTQMASFSNKTLDQYIDKFLKSSDTDFARQGEFMNDVVLRWRDIHMTLQSLTESSSLERPYYFFKYLNYPITESTFQSFQPGINLSIEGLCYTALGVILAFLFYQSIVKMISAGYFMIRPASS